MEKALRINSDFKDYYDICAYDRACIEYDRFSRDRNMDLSMLRSLGVDTVDVKRVREIDGDYLILRNGSTGSIMSRQDAMVMYNNYLASEINERDKKVYRVLQIGVRTFKLQLSLLGYSLDEYKVDSIQEIENNYKSTLKLPIYSIDYIRQVDGKLKAVRLNSVENLKKCGMHEIVKPKEVIDAVYDAILMYRDV
jgi:hypothetical protein